MRPAQRDEPTRVTHTRDDPTHRAPARLFLEGLTGPARGRVFRLRPGTVVVGRDDDCAVRLLDEDVSRRHAEIRVEDDGRALLRDLQSTNGTLLNGRPLSRDVRALSDGDEVGVGASVLRVRRV